MIKKEESKRIWGRTDINIIKELLNEGRVIKEVPTNAYS